MIRSAGAALALLLAVAAPGTSQAPEGAESRQREAFRIVDAYILSNLQESLGLTDDQFVKVLPLVKKLQSDRRAFAQRRFQTLQELRRTLASGVSTEARVVELLRELKRIETEDPALVRRDMDAIDALLSPVQQAKYRVLEGEVERKIRDLMAEIRKQRGGPMRPRRLPDESPPP